MWMHLSAGCKSPRRDGSHPLKIEIGREAPRCTPFAVPGQGPATSRSDCLASDRIRTLYQQQGSPRIRLDRRRNRTVREAGAACVGAETGVEVGSLLALASEPGSSVLALLLARPVGSRDGKVLVAMMRQPHRGCIPFEHREWTGRT